ncbi:MAG: tetratricopeptide repeat protein [Chitinophagales bacterium]|nr:tetratricopeptide repeat protein [Chitinophagaceae bacterium]MCB9064671.1 tetratricopeptide repeat protein [Chitinophagales bacterium]
MQKRVIILLFTQFICWIAAAQPTHLLHKTDAERDNELYDFILELTQKEDFDEYSRKMYELEEWARDNGDEKLAIYFDKSRMVHHDFRMTKSGLKHYEQLAKKAINKNMPGIASQIYTYLGEKYEGTNIYARRFEYLLKAYELYKDLDPTEYPARIGQQRHLAGTYYSYGKYKEAKYYLLDLKKACPDIQNKAMGAGALNTLALIYLNEGHYDSARSILHNIYEHESERKKYSLMAMVAGNIGDSYNRQGSTDSAIYWLLKEAQIVENNIPGKLKKNLASSSIALAKIYYSKGDYSKAAKFIEKAFGHVQKMRAPNYRILEDLYSMHARILAAQGKTQLAYNYMDSSARMKDSVRKRYNTGQVVQAEQRIDSVRHELQLSELEYARKTSEIIRNAAIGIIVLMSVIIILIINRRRLKAHQQREKASLELNNAKKQLTQYTRNLQDKNKQLEQFSTEIEKLRDEQNEVSVNDTILQLQQSTILTDEEWEEFRVMFEKVHSGFIHRLKEKYPEITPAETRYLVLTKLNLDNKEMANILGIGTNAVRNSKFRLRKKFDLPDDSAFDDMVKSI